MIIYDDDKTAFSGHFNYSQFNATKKYLYHYENFMLLNFYLNNPLSTMSEKARAQKELTICERKLTYCRNHPNFSKESADSGVNKIMRNWERR